MNNLQENRAALRFITAVTLFLLAASCCHAVGSKMPRGAYLRHPAPTAAALCLQVKSDPLVMERYSRLFRMTPPLVRGAFAQLRLSHMKSDQISRVYYVHPDEKLGYRLRRVKKGTLVFVLPDGSPALVQICGNPMRLDLKYKRGTVVEARRVIKDFSPEDMDEARAAGPLETDETMDAAQTADAGGIGAGEGRAAAPDSEWSGPGGSDVGFTADAADIAPGFVPSAGGIGGAGGGAGGGGIGGAALTGLAGLTAWIASNGGTGNYQPSGSGSPVSGSSSGGSSGGGGGSGGFGGGSGGSGSGNGGSGGNNGGYTSVVPESSAMTLLIFALLGIGLTQIAVWHRARRQSAN